MKSLAPLLLATAWITLPCHAGGQWIAVVAPGLEEAVQPLVKQRRTEGWEVTVIPAAPDPAPAMKQIAALAAKSQPCCVVLAGDFSDKGVPAGKGTKLRMTGQPSDLPWSAGTAVETGRLPARNAEEARVMVGKILDWPRKQRTQMAFPSAALLAGHHAAPEAFTKIADNLTNTLAQRLIARLPAAWTMDAAVHIDGSPWQVSGSDVRTAAAQMMSTRATLFAYMGHSSPSAAFSKSDMLLDVPEWRKLPVDGPRPGLFFTCGCFSCQVHPQHESFGLAAIRAPGGPPAVIGSHGESWSAMGYLAMSGLTAALEKKPVRVGEYWRAAHEGLEKAEISAAEFAMLDMADGTQGKVPLDQQRAEHMEMWMLLGDPAMPLAPEPHALKVKATAEGSALKVTASVPAAQAGATFCITIERHPAAVPDDLPAVPDSGTERQKASRDRRRLAAEIVFASAEVKAGGTSLTATIPIPANPPAKPWTVRVVSNGDAPVAGVEEVR